MDAIRNLIKSAQDKDAAAFEAAFSDAIAPKIEDALSAKYDTMFGGTKVEQAEEVDEEEVVEEELDEEVLVEFVKVAMQHAKDAIAKGMSHDDAKNHVYKQTMAHAKTKPQQGAGGMGTRIKIDHALDKAEAHLAKHYGSK